MNVIIGCATCSLVLAYAGEANVWRRKSQYVWDRTGNLWPLVSVPLSSIELYSCRSASMGFRRAALSAGQKPEVIPTIERMMNDTVITIPDVCRKMSPS